MKDFDWNWLYHFYLVSKKASLSKASENNGIPLSTLSTSIKRLETFMGSKLFKRSKNGMFFTPEGEAAFSHAQKYFDNIPDFQKLTVAVDERICIVTTLGFAHFYLTKLVGAWRELYPHVALEIFVHPDDHDVDRHGVDIAISKPLYEREDLAQEYIYTGECNLYVSPDYVKRRGLPKTINDLAKHEVIGFTANPIGYYDWFLKDMDNSFNPSLVYNSSPEILRLVMDGVAMGGLDKKCIPADANLIKVFPDMADFHTHFCVIYKKRTPKLERVLSFIRFLREVGKFHETCAPVPSR